MVSAAADGPANAVRRQEVEAEKRHQVRHARKGLREVDVNVPRDALHDLVRGPVSVVSVARGQRRAVAGGVRLFGSDKRLRAAFNASGGGCSQTMKNGR